MVNDEAESFVFSYDSIDNIKSNVRLLVSENMGVSKDYNWPYAKLLATALNGYVGYRNAKWSEISDQAFNNTIGKMKYSSWSELIIEYHNDAEKRRLFIYADSNPKEFIKYFDNIKK